MEPGPPQGPGIVVRCPFWARRAASECGRMRPACRWSSSPCSQSQRTLSPHKSAFVVPQDAGTRQSREMGRELLFHSSG